MTTVFKYIIGALIVGFLLSFLYKSIRSFIDSVKRYRDRKKKFVDDGDSEGAQSDSSDVGKGGDNE